MPTRAEILAELGRAANESFALAVAWHALVAAALAALLLGWRPSRRLARELLVAPVASVSAVAFAFQNPFNGVVFAALAAVLLALGARRDDADVAAPSRGALAAGAAMVSFACVYPHFLAGSPVLYLWGAPMGVVPCPTLALVVGLALAGGLGASAWSRVLAAAGFAYALFGVLRLGVGLDAPLLFGSMALAASPSRLLVETKRTDEAGRLRKHVNVFVGEEPIADRDHSTGSGTNDGGGERTNPPSGVKGA